jgi:hypothetical protein
LLQDGTTEHLGVPSKHPKRQAGPAVSAPARKLIELIPPAVLKTVLGYLVLHYWAHRSGWPDLLVYRPHQWFLAEIKSWRDKLNENQKRWIEDNHRYLHLPFKLVQVHRLECNVSSV